MKHIAFNRKWWQRVAVALAIGVVGMSGIGQANAAVSIVASTPELADIAKYVGGGNVTTYSIAKPNQDYHAVEPRPSDVQRIANADLVVRTGLDLDGWMNALLNAAGNSNLNIGGKGYVDASTGIQRLEIPTGQITGASGDIHVYGNPHYYFDPVAGEIIAKNIARGLIRVDPGHAADYRARLLDFYNKMHDKLQQWRAELAPFRGRYVVTYHKDYEYFINQFGLHLFGTMETRPGIPPSAAHVSQLIDAMKQNNVRAVVVESIFPTNYPDLVQRETGAHYFRVPYSVGSLGTSNYFEMIDLIVKRFKQALSQ